MDGSAARSAMWPRETDPETRRKSDEREDGGGGGNTHFGQNPHVYRWGGTWMRERVLQPARQAFIIYYSCIRKSPTSRPRAPGGGWSGLVAQPWRSEPRCRPRADRRQTGWCPHPHRTDRRQCQFTISQKCEPETRVKEDTWPDSATCIYPRSPWLLLHWTQSRSLLAAACSLSWPLPSTGCAASASVGKAGCSAWFPRRPWRV